MFIWFKIIIIIVMPALLYQVIYYIRLYSDSYCNIEYYKSWFVHCIHTMQYLFLKTRYLNNIL